MDANVTSNAFNAAPEPSELFSSEESIKHNKHAFQQYIYKIFERRELPLSHIAMDIYLTEVEGSDRDVRKDKSTARQLHEQSHVNAFDHLFDEIGADWIKEEEFGSLNAFFAAVALHDIIEDFNLSPKVLEEHLCKRLEVFLQNDLISQKEYQRAKKDIKHTINIVINLSRTDEMGKSFEKNDRIAQAKKWLNHPYCVPIKLVDWCNKLQTMVGVDHFEKDNYAGMLKVLAETSLIFVDEQQAIVKKAIEKYPFITKACEPLDAVMGILYQTLCTYHKLKSKSTIFKPESADGFNFTGYFERAISFLSRLPKGNNYIYPVVERLELNAKNDHETRAFLDYMFYPSFRDPTNQAVLDSKIAHNLHKQ